MQPSGNRNILLTVMQGQHNFTLLNAGNQILEVKQVCVSLIEQCSVFPFTNVLRLFGYIYYHLLRALDDGLPIFYILIRFFSQFYIYYGFRERTHAPVTLLFSLLLFFSSLSLLLHFFEKL